MAQEVDRRSCLNLVVDAARLNPRPYAAVAFASDVDDCSVVRWRCLVAEPLGRAGDRCRDVQGDEALKRTRRPIQRNETLPRDNPVDEPLDRLVGDVVECFELECST